jgi:hypothetical protein
LTVVAVIALLFGAGFLLYRSMRRGARLAQAEARLKQVSAGLELYFRDNHAYPDEGAELQVALAPYVDEPAVFDNPLRDDDLPGEDLNQYYRQPSLRILDRPGYYIVCYPPGSEDDPITVLETGDRVTRKINPGYDAETLQRDTLLSFLYPQPEVSGDDDDPSGGDDGDSEDPPEPPEEPTSENDPDEYTEEPGDGEIAPRACSWATFDVRAADLTWGVDGPDVPITISTSGQSGGQGGDGGSLFGGGPVTAGQNDSLLLLPDQSYALTFHAEHGSWAATYSSDGDPTHVLTLRNGDQPVEFDPYNNPIPVGGELTGLIDPNTGEVTIADSEVLYLVELGSTSPASSGYDFQDAIVLASFTDADPAECEAEDDSEDGGFDTDDGDVVTRVCSDVTIHVVGTQFGYADDTLVDIGCSACVDDPETSEDGEWWSFNDGAPIQGGEEHTDYTVHPGTEVTLEGEILGSYERWLWSQYGYPLSYRSDGGSDQVLVYQDGDQPPSFAPGYPCQASAGDLVEPYIDPQTGVVTIDDTQVIYLWDFNPVATGEGIDYQDLIVLATAVSAESECEGETEGGSQPEEGFDIDDGEDVVTRICSDVIIQVVGSQFGYADGTLVDIGCQAMVDDPQDPEDGEWWAFNGGSPVQGGESYTDYTVHPGTEVALRGEILGSYERWLWSQYGYPLSYASNGGSDQVLVYQNGDQPPDFAPGFPCQASAEDLVAPYIDPQTGVVTIEDNQVIYLWDFNPVETGDGIDYQDLIVLATAVSAESECEGETETGGGGGGAGDDNDGDAPTGSAISGMINLNPRNNSNFEFVMETPDGSQITRDDLHGTRPAIEYTGAATRIVVCPKGNGNQNGLTVDGESVRVRNGRRYTIESNDMQVHLYNDRVRRGRAMGRWWIEINAQDATIEVNR